MNIFFCIIIIWMSLVSRLRRIDLICHFKVHRHRCCCPAFFFFFFFFLLFCIWIEKKMIGKNHLLSETILSLVAAAATAYTISPAMQLVPLVWFILIDYDRFELNDFKKERNILNECNIYIIYKYTPTSIIWTNVQRHLSDYIHTHT